MLTYQIRKRVFRLSENRDLDFPNSAEVCFEFQPLQAFGMEAGNGRTCVRAVPANVLFNGNTGQHTIESQIPLKPLEMRIEDSVREVKISGNRLCIKTPIGTLDELSDITEGIYYVFPMLLNVEFADPPVISHVYGQVGDVPFKWELTGWKMTFETTTQEIQEKKVADSWLRLDLIAKESVQRLVAALHYFHVACRLARIGNFPWEFMSEAILNYCKILEVLFLPQGDGKTMDAARSGLRELGYLDEEIERDFIPAMALRNWIDVGHVHLSLLTQVQLQILHRYTESAELHFRLLIRRLFERVQAGSYTITPYTDLKAKRKVTEIIDRLAQHYGADGET